jgi:hypothetical protein
MVAEYFCVSFRCSLFFSCYITPSYFTVDKGVDGIEGMRASWNTLSSHVGELLPFALTGAGLITVFGWIVTMPLVVLMTGYSYVRIQGYDVIR